MQAETKFGIKVDRDLALLKNAWFENIQQVAIRGTPDRLGVIRGIFIAIELKSSQKARRPPLQAHKLELISKAGGFCVFVYPENWDEIYKFLKAIDDEPREHSLQKIVQWYQD